MGAHEQNWRDQSMCQDLDADEIEEKFFPHPNSDGADAKEICAVCPVAAECLENAEEFGVWGGLTERERAKLRGRIKTGAPKFRGADNVAFVLEHHPLATARDVADRLGLDSDAVKRAVSRAGRTDLRDQLNRNAGLAGFSVTAKGKTA